MAQSFDNRWRTRFSRQIALDRIGEPGQRRLAESHALLVGCGALGCVLAETLVRAGVGALTIIDRDIVDETNLHRQTLFDARDARDATPKAEAARRRLRAIAPTARVEPRADDFTPAFARSLRRDGWRFGVILDATDNFETRYLVNDFAVATGAPLVYAGVIQTHGVMLSVLPRPQRDGDAPSDYAGFETPCLRCVFPDPPAPGAVPTCETAGVLPSAVSVIAGLQATEALKMLLARFADVSRSLLSVDVWTGAVRRIEARADDACPCCGSRRFDFLDAARTSSSATLCGRSSVQIAPPESASIDIPALARRLSHLGEFRATTHALHGALRDERTSAGEPVRITVFPDGRTIVAGVADVSRARAIHARFVGG